MPKIPPFHRTTCVATQLYQGLLMNFYFSGITCDDIYRKTIHEGINGETCWILITDHFTGMKHGDTRISKASHIAWLGYLLNQYYPICNNKQIHLDKGGELFNNPYVKNLLHIFCYNLHPTGSDTSYQNGPVELDHTKLANYIKAMLTGTSLNIKFWPYSLYHVIQLYNYLSEPNAVTSMIGKSKYKQDNLSFLHTFGCSVYVWPPGKIRAKLNNHISKRIFLGYGPHTNLNVLYYDVDTHRIKLASHVRFLLGYE